MHPTYPTKCAFVEPKSGRVQAPASNVARSSGTLDSSRGPTIPPPKRNRKPGPYLYHFQVTLSTFRGMSRAVSLMKSHKFAEGKLDSDLV